MTFGPFAGFTHGDQSLGGVGLPGTNVLDNRNQNMMATLKSHWPLLVLILVVVYVFWHYKK